MRSGKQAISLKDNPEGYITDIMEDSIKATKSNTGDVQFKFINLPDIGTIIFNLELLNMTGTKHPRFTIETYQSFDTINQTITDTQLPAFPVDDGVEEYVTLTYYRRNFQLAGEKVRIKYKGKPNIPLMPQHTLQDGNLHGIRIRGLVQNALNCRITSTYFIRSEQSR